MKRIKIEDLLAWAYRQELPKAGSGAERHEGGTDGGGWDGVTLFGEYLTLPDMWNRWGCAPDFSDESDPHPDAVVVGRTVKAMADVSFDVGAGWDVLGGLVVEGGPLSDAERADCHARGAALSLDIREGRLPGLIIRAAMLGRGPGWGDHGAVARRVVCGANGKPCWFRTVTRASGEGRPPVSVEMDGYDRQSQRPHPDAYQKTRLSPDPARLVADRLDYQAYVTGLADLTARLQVGECGALAAHDVVESDLPLWPWECAPGAYAEIAERGADEAERRAVG